MGRITGSEASAWRRFPSNAGGDAVITVRGGVLVAVRGAVKGAVRHWWGLGGIRYHDILIFAHP